MRFRAAFPALVTAKPPRRATTRCVVRRETEVDVTEVAAEDAPVVMTVSGKYLREVVDWGGPVPVRRIGGRYYRPTMPVETFSGALLDPLGLPGDLGHRRERLALHAAVTSRVSRDLTMYTGPVMKPWPGSVEHMVRTDWGSERFFSAYRDFRDLSPRIKLDAEAEAEAEGYERLFRSAFEGMAIVDGTVWRETLEPVYCVLLPQFMGVAFPERLLRSPFPSDDGPIDPHSHFFPADRREDAMAFLRAHCEAFPSEFMDASSPEITVHDPDGMSGADKTALALLASADFLLAKLKEPHVGHTVSGRDAVAELEREVAASDPDGEMAPGLEDAVIRILSHAREVPGQWRTGVLSEQDLRMVQLHIDRQDGRVFSVTFGAPRP